MDETNSEAHRTENKRRRESLKRRKETMTKFVKHVLEQDMEALVFEKENVAPGTFFPVPNSSIWQSGNERARKKRLTIRQQTEQEGCSAAKRRRLR